MDDEEEQTLESSYSEAVAEHEEFLLLLESAGYVGSHPAYIKASGDVLAARQRCESARSALESFRTRRRTRSPT
jgi:hypothetical protein